MNKNVFSFVSIVGLLVFGGIGIVWVEELARGTHVIVLVASGALIGAVAAPQVRLGSILAKITLFMSLFLLIQLWFTEGAISFGFDERVRFLGFLTGVWLERHLPHTRFFSWMYLAFAAKAQAVLVGVLSSTLTLLPSLVAAWWAVVAGMALGVMCLAFGKYQWYRWWVRLYSVYVLVLCFVTLLLVPVSLLSEYVVLTAAVVWPLVAYRVVGRLSGVSQTNNITLVTKS